MYTCAVCKVHACTQEDKEKLPKNCPSRQAELEREALCEYSQPQTKKFFCTAAEVEAEGYCEWPRVREIIEFSKKMGYKKLGLAFCIGLAAEAEVCNRMLCEAGFQVESVICKNGGVPKTEVGIPPEQLVHLGTREVMCNPIGQAKLLEQAETEFNIALGLCVGHDSLFFKYSHAPVTVLVAKDRVLAHNPVAAFYPANRYMKNRL